MIENNELVTFNPQSPLLGYLRGKGLVIPEILPMKQILLFLKDIISSERLYDPKNAAIILCDSDLTIALGMPALHLTEIRSAIEKQVTARHYAQELSARWRRQLRALLSVRSVVPQIAVVAPGNTAVSAAAAKVPDAAAAAKVPDAAAAGRRLCSITDGLREVFMDVDGYVFKDRYTYSEITAMLSRYIVMNRERFFDERNIKICMVRDDKLGRLFDVTAFHRNQVVGLLQAHIFISESEE